MMRKKYTEDEIDGIPCSRCGKPSVSQWDCCATGNEPMALCVECDIKLNRLALEFIEHPKISLIMRAYAATKRVLHNPKYSKKAMTAAGKALTHPRTPPGR